MAFIEIIGLGAMNVDCLCEVDETVVDGEQVVSRAESQPGGSAANTIYALAKLGVKTGFVGAVGMDENGERLVDDFKNVGTDTKHVQLKTGTRTGSTACFSDKLARRALYVSPGANNSLAPEDINMGYLEKARVVHLSSFADDTQFDLQVNLVKQIAATVKLTLAPGMLYATKELRSLAPLLEKSSIVFMNRDEIERLTGKDFRTGASECVSLGCQMVVITLGKGSTVDEARTATAYVRDEEREYEIEAQEEVAQSNVESTGAGDAFAAGFLFGILKGKAIRECGLLGDITARFAIEEMGARKGLPSLAQLTQVYLRRSGRQL